MKKLQMEELGRMGVQQYKAAEKNNSCVVLDDLRSAHNVGSIFRTSDAFRWQKLWLCGHTALPPNKELEKTALGATQSVDWEHKPTALDAVHFLKSNQWQIVVLEQTSSSISLMNLNLTSAHNYAWILGNEVMGVNEDVLPLADHLVEIPQFGTKHSLNVAISFGMVVWHTYLQLGRP